MVYRTPTYYKDFRCIAGECRDSCCKGWEIDIDEAAAGYYETVGGAMGKRLRENIRDGSFVLTKDESCPFLNKSGLCDIFTELGEDKLCRICSDHPRYYEWFDGLKEGGVGLCCEAAAELILSRPFSLCQTEIPCEEAAADYDEELFELIMSAREEIFAALDDEGVSLAEALCRMLDIAEEVQGSIDIPFPDAEGESCYRDMADIFRCFEELEPIDEKWLPYIKGCAEMLDSLPAHNSSHDIYLRRIVQYLIFRYLLKGVYDGEVLGYAKFAAVSAVVIDRLFRYKAALSGSCSFSDCAEAAKNYSKETEYCEENMAELLEAFAGKSFFSVKALKALISEKSGRNAKTE